MECGLLLNVCAIVSPVTIHCCIADIFPYRFGDIDHCSCDNGRVFRWCLRASGADHLHMLVAETECPCLDYRCYIILISMSTPAGRFRFDNSSIVFAVGLTMSIKRLCTRISYCSRAFLCTNVDRNTV